MTVTKKPVFLFTVFFLGATLSLTAQPAGNAAASEEVRRYVPHIVCGRSPLQQVLANGKAPLVFPISKKLNVEPLSEVRTPLADFFQHPASLRIRRTSPETERDERS